MTTTPAYGFRISGKGGGPMSTAVKAGDLSQIKGVLARRFPTLRFEEADTEEMEIAKPEEAEAAPTPMAVVDEEKDQSTKELYDTYLATMPMAVRGLVTTDYKGTRGGRLGAGSVYTADMLPGAKAEAPKEEAPKAAAPTQSTVTTTYNAPVIGGDWQQYYGDYYAGNVNYGGSDRGSSSSAPSKPSAPAAPAPPLNQQIAAKAISQAGGGGVSAAAKSTGSSDKLNFAEAKALMNSGLSPSQIKERAQKQGLQLSDNARRALQGKGKK